MKKLLILFAIVALGSCKKEENKAPTTPPTTTTATSKLFVVDLQSSEPIGPFFGYNLYLNGDAVSSPLSVYQGDTINLSVFNPLGHAYILKCNLDNVNQYPNENYIYTDVTWNYIVN